MAGIWLISNLVNINQLVWDRVRWSDRKLGKFKLKLSTCHLDPLWLETLKNWNESKSWEPWNTVDHIYLLIKGLSGGERQREAPGDWDTFSGNSGHSQQSCGNGRGSHRDSDSVIIYILNIITSTWYEITLYSILQIFFLYFWRN